MTEESTSGIPSRSALRLLWLWTFVGYALFPLLWDFLLPGVKTPILLQFPVGGDFVNVWTGAKLALSGHAATVFSWDDYTAAVPGVLGAIGTGKELGGYNFSYPPSLLLFAVPFGLLPYLPALAAWTAAGVAAFVTALRAGPFGQLPRAALILLLLSPVALVNIEAGQNGFFTAALFLGGLYLSEKRPVAGGVLIGLLTIKPQLGLLIPLALLLRRNWRCIAAAAATALALVGLSGAIWGFDTWTGYVTNVLPHQAGILTGKQTFVMMTSVFSNAIFGDPSARSFWALVQAAAALFAIAVTYKTVKTEGISPRAVLLLAFGTQLVTPYCFDYDMMMIMGAMALYFGTRERISRGTWIASGALWALPMAVYTLRLASFSLLVSVIEICAFTLLWREERGRPLTPPRP